MVIKKKKQVNKQKLNIVFLTTRVLCLSAHITKKCLRVVH